MLSSCLLSGLGIGIISTGVYVVFTNEKGDINNRKIECSTIFCIILLVSVLVLYITSSSNKEEIVPINMTKGMVVGSKIHL